MFFGIIYEQDNSNSGDVLADNVKKMKAIYSMNQSISNKRLRLSSSLLVLLGIQHPFTQATQKLAKVPPIF